MQCDPADKSPAPDGMLLAQETQKQVQQVLAKLPAKDRNILRAVFFEQRDKDEVCAELGVSREYLRVLLHRAKQQFMAEYSQLGAMPRNKPVAFAPVHRKASHRQNVRPSALAHCG